MNTRNIKPLPAVIIGRVEVCRGNVCTIEEARGTAFNAKTEIRKMLNNMKLHAFYLYIDRTEGLDRFNELRYDEQLREFNRKRLTTKILSWQIKYITPERYTTKRVNRKGKYYTEVRSVETGSLITRTKWSNKDSEVIIEDLIDEVTLRNHNEYKHDKQRSIVQKRLSDYKETEDL